MITRKLTASHVLIGLNVLVFMTWYGLNPASPGSSPLALYLPEHPDFRIWQYLSSMFMHGNTGHLLMNMFGLFMFGSVLERIWGPKRFVIFFLATGLGAGVIYSGVTTFEIRSKTDKLVEMGFQPEAIERGLKIDINNSNTALNTMAQGAPQALLTEKVVDDLVDLYSAYHTPVVGASGALYGVLTAFGLLFPNAKLGLMFIPVPVPAKFFIPGLLLLDLFSGVTGFSLLGGGIAHFAHIGGAIIGFLLMRHWRDLAVPQSPWQRPGGYQSGTDL